MTSIEKLENVVNEPKKPIIKKNLIKVSLYKLFSRQPINNPMKNEPVKLTKKVPTGKLGEKNMYKL